MAITSFLTANSAPDLHKVAEILNIPAEEIAKTVGLEEPAAQPGTAATSDEIQRRLSGLAQLFKVLKPRFYSQDEACAWYRSKRIPGFGGHTARQLAQQDRTREVLEYIDPWMQAFTPDATD